MLLFTNEMVVCLHQDAQLEGKDSANRVENKEKFDFSFIFEMLSVLSKDKD